MNLVGSKQKFHNAVFVCVKIRIYAFLKAAMLREEAKSVGCIEIDEN